MSQLSIFIRRAELVHTLPREVVPHTVNRVWQALAAIVAITLASVAHAQGMGVDVKDETQRSDIKEIKNRIGSGDLNKTASNIDKTTSDLLKEVKTSVAKLGFTATLTPNVQLQKISNSGTATYIQQACPSPSALSGATAAAGAAGATQTVTSVTTIGSGDAGDAKQKICEEVIKLRVQAYNESIDMAKRFEEYKKQIDSIDDNRQSAKTQGDLWANTNESLRTIGKLQAEMGFWRTRVAAYDAAIKFHEGQQNALSQNTIKGSTGSTSGSASGIAKTLISTSVLAGILAIK